MGLIHEIFVFPDVFERVRSSVVERYICIVEARGSIPRASIFFFSSGAQEFVLKLSPYGATSLLVVKNTQLFL